ncbi:MAG: hypothetical protein QM778_04390 [Myxococcales bacterium]
MANQLFAALLVAYALVQSGCGSSLPAPTPPPRSASPAAPPPPPAAQMPAPSAGLSRLPTPNEAHLISELVGETERIRKLRFKEPVQVRIQNRTAMRGYVSRAIEQEDLVRGRRRYVALGLLDPKLDVRDLLESLMEEELIGYYDPKERLLAVRDDVARALGKVSSANDLEWRATVVHELVHALQDQHLGLGAAMDVERTTDGDNAFGALVEGDATLAMLGYVAGKAGVTLQEVVRDRLQLQNSLGASPDRITGALKAAPAIVREPLLFRYRSGALFAASLFLRGEWEAVNQAHANVPGATLSVIEPRYFQPAQSPAREPRVELPDLSWLEAHGYRQVDQDVLGSLEFGVALGLPEPAVAALTRAWRGDRYAVLEPLQGDGLGGDASVWCLRFGSAKDARGAHSRLGQLRDTYGLDRRALQVGATLIVARGLPAAATEELFARFAKERAADVP